jgi:hypothetical protein
MLPISVVDVIQRNGNISNLLTLSIGYFNPASIQEDNTENSMASLYCSVSCISTLWA